MRRPLALVMLASLLLLAVGGMAACGAIEDDPPVRNPLTEPSPSPTPVVTTAPTATGTAPTPGARPPLDGTPDPALGEAAAGRAIELLAEWLGIPSQQLEVVVVEPTVWPDACLGIEQPGMFCAQVVTPGFRMLFRDALGGLHAVHAEPVSGAARWAGEVRVEGRVTALDATARRVTLEVNGAPLELRLAPGTLWIPPDAEATAVGQRVVAAYDPAGSAAGTATAAWIAVEPA